MLTVPVGRWEMIDRMMKYSSYHIPPDDYDVVVPQMVSLLTRIAAVEETNA